MFRRRTLPAPPAGAAANVRWGAVHPRLRPALGMLAWAVWRRRAVAIAAFGLAAAAVWALGVVAASRVVAVPSTGRFVLAGLIAVAGCVAVASSLRPRPWQAAVAGDRAGLQERLITALELGDRDDPLARLQREDAVAAVAAGRWRGGVAARWPRLPLAAAALAVALAGALLALPDRAAELRRLRAAVQAEAARQGDLVARAAERMAPPGAAAVEPSLVAAARALRRLEQALRRAEGERQALLDLTEAARDVGRLVDPSRAQQGRALAELGAALASTERARRAGEALALREWRSAQQGLEALAMQLERGERAGGAQTPSAADASGRADREAIARALAESTRAAGPETRLADAMRRAARELRAGNDAAAAQALRDLARLAAEAGRSADAQAALAEALRTLQQAQLAVARAADPTGRREAGDGRPGDQARSGQEARRDGMAGGRRLVLPQAAGGPPQPATSPVGGAEGGDGAQDGSAGESGEAGERSGAGRDGAQPTDLALLESLGLIGGGRGEGQDGPGGEDGDAFGRGGGGGDGFGEGDGDGDASGEGDGSPRGRNEPGTRPSDRVTAGGIAQGPGQARTGEPPREYRNFDLIWAPTRLGGENDPDHLSGPLGRGGGQAVETESSPVGAPDLRPYAQVYGEYREQARQAVQRAELPPALEELVKRYFTSLAPDESAAATEAR